MPAPEFIYDVSMADFDRQVIIASKERPVVVDFWAPWCAPCRTLGPILENVINSLRGKVALAKVNCDENAQLAQALGVQGIPAVFMFVDGRPTRQFSGAQPEHVVREFIEAALPSSPDRLIAEGDKLMESGQTDEAVRRYEDALKDAPDNSGALLRLGRQAMARAEVDAARDYLERIEIHSQEYRRAQALLAGMEFARICQDSGGRQDCEQRAIECPENPDALYRLACCRAADGETELALEAFLKCLSVDRSFENGAAREAIVNILARLEADSDIARTYRRRLASVLY